MYKMILLNLAKPLADLEQYDIGVSFLCWKSDLNPYILKEFA
jgi:hypothetical protein